MGETTGRIDARTGVFVSAVTSEFGRARDLVASDLRAKGFDVTFQQDFRQGGESSTTLEMLDDYIRECKAVVCIIGARSGSVPSEAEAVPFATSLPPTLERASYTQWELILARHHQKRLFVYHATPEFVPDEPEPIGEDHPDLQARYVDWLFGRDGLGQRRDSFSDSKDLQIKVLRTEFGTVVGERRAADQLDAGLDVHEQRPPKVRRRDPAEANRLPPNRHPLYGRDEELEEVLEAIEGRFDNLVLLVGEPGIGKRALLQELAHSERLPTDFADGAGIYPPLNDERVAEDLRQAIWEEFYEADDPSTVAPRQRFKDLQGLEALLIVPDIDPFVEHLPDLRDDMPGIWICASASSDHVEELSEALQASEEIDIDGLTDETEMLALFEDRYRAEVPAAARQHIVDLCVERGGNPARIELLAQAARKEAKAPRRPDPDAEHPLVAWATGRQSEVTPPEQRRAMEVTEAVGTDVPRAVLADSAGSATAIDDAVRDGRLEEGSPKYRLNPVLESARADDAEAVTDTLAEVFEHTMEWARGASLSEFYSNRAFVLRMAEWGVARGEQLRADASPDAAHAVWTDVIELGRLAEPAMALGGRHGAWESLLLAVEASARADMELTMPPGEGDSPTSNGPDHVGPAPAADSLGWALHQRGSRALLRDELNDARAHLCQSLRYRSDEEGRELTRKNLLLIPLAVVPFVALLLVPLLIGGVATAQFLSLTTAGVETGIVDIDQEAMIFPATPDPRSTVSNVGDDAIWIGEIRIDGIKIDESPATEFFDVDEADDADAGPAPCAPDLRLAPEESCTITVQSLSEDWDTALLTIDVRTKHTGGKVLGDQSILLING